MLALGSRIGACAFLAKPEGRVRRSWARARPGLGRCRCMAGALPRDADIRAQLIASLALMMMFASQQAAIAANHRGGLSPEEDEVEHVLMVSADVFVFVLLF